MKGIFVFLIIILLVAGAAFLGRHALIRGLAGTGMFNGMYVRSTIQLPHISGATSYNIYYSMNSDSSFPYSVRNISTTDSSYTISYLRKNVAYEYKISALNKSGKEIWWSKVSPVSATQPM